MPPCMIGPCNVSGIMQAESDMLASSNAVKINADTKDARCWMLLKGKSVVEW